MTQLTIGLAEPARLDLGPGTFALPGFALPWAAELARQVAAVAIAAPWRHMVTPGGQTMSVAMTNCGTLGWVSDATGYRYHATDPLNGRPWPALPDTFVRLARDAADAVGWFGFVPDTCLVNRYAAGAQLTLHQDRNEADFSAPIVSVSLGVPAMFLLGGAERRGPPRRLRLVHGDVLVWGGADRLRYHGVAPLRRAWHPAFGEHRVNLTFRRAA